MIGVGEKRLQRVRVHRSGDLMLSGKLSLSLLATGRVIAARVVLLAPKEFCHQFTRR